jgi:hypothetical protein
MDAVGRHGNVSGWRPTGGMSRIAKSCRIIATDSGPGGSGSASGV